ncbi:MAG: peptide deformylase [Cytophagales bacterium]|jgi:peptide deformylase|nr:peptide deformylase [Cytophagales bacterium]
MIYPIVVFGNKVLRKQCKKVERGEDLKQLIDDMFATMYNANGVGLAAPQIGKDLTLLVIDFSDYVEEGSKWQVEMINPELTLDEDSEFIAAKEGCLSLPGISREVFRKNKISVKYFDRDWQEHDEIYEGFAARIVQHEYDHLDGKLFIDYSETATIKQQLKDIKNRDVDTDYEII